MQSGACRGAERTIGELNIGGRTDAIVLAFRTAEGKFDTTPSSDDRLHADDTLKVLGSRAQLTRLGQLLIRGEEISED